MVWAPDAPPSASDPAGDVPPERLSLTEVASHTRLEVLRSLGSGPGGLMEARAEARLSLHGENTLPERRPASWPRRFVRCLKDPFTLVLLCLGVVSAVIASWGTACVIVILVAVTCVLRSNGEYRADRSTAALRKLLGVTATVRRRPDGRDAPAEREIPADQLVPGDVIKLGPGDLVPADVRLLRSSGLTVHQAALTGESAPVTKQAGDVPGGADGHLCWQGSSVASGSALAVIVATGADTRFAGVHQQNTHRLSAFDRSVNGISWILVRLMLLVPPLALVANAVFRGRGLEALPFSVAVAVGLTPEMLPVVVTTALARGSAALARTHAVIVKRLPALHDLGAIDVLCVDKTGTLTQDRPRLDRCVDHDGRPDPAVLRWASVNSFWTLQLADLPAADPLDEAILDAEQDLGDYEGVDALAFDPVLRISCAVVSQPARRATHLVVVKGAVEDVLGRCARTRDAPLDPMARRRLRRLAGRLAGKGLRVLAVALAERSYVHRLGDERGLTFLGFVAMRDTLAPHAAQALAGLAERGVAVKVLTGDHPATAARVCRELGLDPGDVVTGRHIDGLADTALADLARRSTVFARCTAEHKARLVRALRLAGHTTGFLGDGVNDLPAMRAADVGVCPREAADVTREAADVVLATKDLTTIGEGIVVGRRSTGNIAAYLRVALSSNAGNVIAMLAAGLLLPFLPMLPAQVLVQNLCFDAAQLAFAFDRADPGIARRPVRVRPRELLRFVAAFGALNAVADLATFAALIWAFPEAVTPSGQSAFHSGWLTENLLTQALVMLLLRPGRHVSRPLKAATGALACLSLLLPLSPAAAALGLTTLPIAYYLLLAAVIALYGGAIWTLSRTRDRCGDRRP
ncbi:magnesium-translocating P-type ATPase [Microbispora sp. NBC_01189]|uniref:magnesium-translocating P-type ATPase n=1 Tax=Microbispora sp. NBC_01189 TaxID=2903583 RepID=UPI002E1395D6|nr:magnesium-translocating P-type ATPase [Microbispora sp. NBC_01189]